MCNNKNGIFSDVHRQFKFCTILGIKKSGKSNSFLADFHQHDDGSLRNFRKTGFNYDVNLIKLCSPDKLTLIECGNQINEEIFQKLYKYPLLNSNEWSNFMPQSSEFHMSQNANLFHTANVGFPLYKGENMHQFTHIHQNFGYWIEEKAGIDFLKGKEEFRWDI